VLLEVGGQGVVSSSAARGDVVDDCVDGVCVGGGVRARCFASHDFASAGAL